MPRRKGGAKYFSKKCVVDGITFDSKKEGDRYLYLKSLEKSGEISDLQLQVPFLLLPAQYEERIEYTTKTHKEKKVKKLVEKQVVYKSDFVYYNKDGQMVVEDVKGFRNSTAYSVFVLKRKLMLYVHNIRIVEV